MELETELKQLQRKRVERKQRDAPFVIPERTDRPRPDARPIQRLFEMGDTQRPPLNVPGKTVPPCPVGKINELRDFSWLGEPVTGVYIQAPVANQNNQSYIPYFLGPYHPNLGFRPTIAFWNLWCQTNRPIQQGDVFYLTTTLGERLGFIIRYVLRKGGVVIQNEEAYRKRHLYWMFKQGRKSDIVAYYKGESIDASGLFQVQAVGLITTWIGRCLDGLEKKFSVTFADKDLIQHQLDYSFRFEGTVDGYLHTALSTLTFLDPSTDTGKLCDVFQRRFAHGYYDPRDLRTRLFHDKCPEVGLALTKLQLDTLRSEWKDFSDKWVDEAIYQIYLSMDITRKANKRPLPVFRSSLFSLFKPYQVWCSEACDLTDKNTSLDDLVVVQVDNNPANLRCFNIKNLVEKDWDLKTDPLDDKEKLPPLISDTLFSLYPERDRVGFVNEEEDAPLASKKEDVKSHSFLAQTLLQRMHSDLDYSESYYAMHPYPTYYASPKNKTIKSNVCRGASEGRRSQTKCCICSKLIAGSPIKSVQVLGDNEDEDRDVMIKKYCSGQCFEKEEDWEPESEKEQTEEEEQSEEEEE